MLPADYEDSSDDSDDSFYFSSSTQTKKEKRAKFCYVRPELERLQEEAVQAIAIGDLEMMKECITKIGPAFDLDHAIYDGYTLMMHACNEAQPDVVQFLIDAGASPHHVEDSNSPLLVACNAAKDHELVTEVVKILLVENVVINISNKYGDTPLICAVQNGYTEVVKMLLKRKASLDATNNTTGNSAIFYACEKNYIDIVTLLLEHGASHNIPNHRGYLPKIVALNHGFQDIYQLFPQEDKENVYTIPSNYMSMTHYTDMAPGILRPTEVPPYFYRILSLLTGMELDFLHVTFAKNKISLPQFLTLTQTQIKDLEIEFPFLQKKILFGLFRFHAHKWRKKSVARLPNAKLLDTFHLFTMFCGHLQHLMVMRCSLTFILQQGRERQWNLPKEANLKIALQRVQEFTKILNEYKILVGKIHQESPKSLFTAITPTKVQLAGKQIKKMRNAILKVSAIGFIAIAFGMYLKRR